eukprot:gene17843-5611_t
MGEVPRESPRAMRITSLSILHIDINVKAKNKTRMILTFNHIEQYDPARDEMILVDMNWRTTTTLQRPKFLGKFLVLKPIDEIPVQWVSALFNTVPAIPLLPFAPSAMQFQQYVVKLNLLPCVRPENRQIAK